MLFLQIVTNSNLKDNCVVELINEFNKDAGYKIDKQKLTVLLYTSNE